MSFAVTVRDHMMIAHSLSGEVFGPAQRLHGATYVTDATFRAPALGEDGIVIDIGAAATALHEVLSALSYRNLDDEPALRGINTTTERLCELVATRLVTAAREGLLGDAARSLTSIEVTLHESHIAWASCEVTL